MFSPSFSLWRVRIVRVNPLKSRYSAQRLSQVISVEDVGKLDPFPNSDEAWNEEVGGVGGGCWERMGLLLLDW